MKKSPISNHSMKIYLARHGQSRWQVERDDGDWNSPLTELGHRQAWRLGQWLAGKSALDNGAQIEIAHLRASPLIRAQQTAAHCADALQLPIATDDALREADFLVSDYLPSADSPYQKPPDYTPADTYATFKVQAGQALQALVADAESSGGPVLGIAHGGLISTLLRLATGSDSISFWIYNASLHLIEWKRGRWHLVHLNLWDHLSPELRTF